MHKIKVCVKNKNPLAGSFADRGKFYYITISFRNAYIQLYGHKSY